MSLLNTKPRWFKGEVIATSAGWVNPANNEVLVAIGNLKAKLEAEGVVLEKPKKERKERVKKEKPVVQETPVVEIKAESKVELKEEVLLEVKAEQQLLGEVVEIKLDSGTEEIKE